MPLLTIFSTAADKSIAQQPVMDWFMALQPPVQSAVIGGLVSIFVAILTLSVAWMSLRVARGSKELTEQKLFADLLKLRVEWRNDFKAAVKKRRYEIYNCKIGFSGEPSQEGAILVKERQAEATTYFDVTVNEKVGVLVTELDRQEKALTDKQRLGKKIPNSPDMRNLNYKVDQMMNDVVSSLKLFLYVGRIKQHTKEAKPAPPISGLFDN